MYYPNHDCRNYCLYLGSEVVDGNKYDLGVYIQKDGSVSHAIVYGNKPEQYISGTFLFKGSLCKDWESEITTLNKIAYGNWVLDNNNNNKLFNFSS